MTFSNREDIPLSLAVWLATDDYVGIKDPNALSATTLLLPTKAIVLSVQFAGKETVNDIADYIALRSGHAYHDSIERSWKSPSLADTLQELGYDPDLCNSVIINPMRVVSKKSTPVYMEQRSSRKFNGFTINGKYDFVGDGTLEDFKTTSVWSYIYQSSVDKFKLQGSIYKWLNPKIITKPYMWIRWIFTDWSSVKAKQDKNYPKSRLHNQKIDLMETSEIEAWLQIKTDEIKSNLNKPQEDLPPCTPDELWAKPDIWKYYKDPTKLTRSTKNCTSITEATQRYNNDGCIGLIKHVPGEVVRCKYCFMQPFCLQAQELTLKGLLRL